MLMGAGLNRPERKRADILVAARSVFLRQGYQDAGMELVARTAGVSTATLYAYFPSKATLFEVMIQDLLGEMAEPIRESLEVRGDARARLTALAQAYAAFCARPSTRAMFRMILAERRRFQGLADLLLRGARAELGGAAMALIGDLAAADELVVDKPASAAGQLLGMIDHPTLLLGLTAGDAVQPGRPLAEICAEAVETFLARYG